MKLTADQLNIITRYMSAIEAGDPDGDYGNVTRLYDGPGGRRQLTYGKHQTTEAGRNLQRMIGDYLKRRREAGLSEPYSLQRLVAAPTYSLVGDAAVIRQLREAGDDPLMREVQDEFFETHYMRRARKWAEDNGFKCPLSMLVIYDSFVQSGSIPMWLRRRFAEAPPSGGGSEGAWIFQYLSARYQWLKWWGNGKDARSRAIRASKYRVARYIGGELRDGLLAEVLRGNWDLEKRPITVNGISVAE